MSTITQPQPSRVPITSHDMDMVARAFGFQSYSHLERVLKGDAPSALQEGSRNWRSRQ